MTDTHPIDQMIAEAAVAQREASVQDAMELAGVVAAPDDRIVSQANPDGGIPQEPILALPGQITPTALILPPGLSYAQWEQVGKRLAMVQGAVLWWAGDWWAYGEHHYGEMVSQGAVAFPQYALQTLYNAAWVSGKIRPSSRLESLPWSYHQEVARLPAEDGVAVDRLLRLAAPAEGSDQPRMSREELRQAVREVRVKTGDLKEPDRTGEDAEDAAVAAEILETIAGWVVESVTFSRQNGLDVTLKTGPRSLGLRKTLRCRISGDVLKVEVE